jgi:hypothetical protein
MTRLSALSMLRSALLLAVCVPASVAVAQDLNVNGSLCVGFDCPPPGGFGFDTIVLRENNLRIFFDDTSVSAGFPANKWRITINDSAGGGVNFFSVDDATANRSIFKVTAGAPANSLFVASTGNVGLGTASPGLDLTISTSDTPAIRLEQTAGGGFPAQTWDIGANEANFFVRDVTSGSRLPLRIRPGAPTSSIDISASGNVGVGTASPNSKLQVNGVDDNTNGQLMVISSGNDARIELRNADGGIATGRGSILMSRSAGFEGLRFMIAGVDRMILDEGGNLGIGTTAPGAQLHTTGSVRFAGVPSCGAGIVSAANGTLSCLASSRTVKNLAGELSTHTALANIMALRPQTGSYRDTPDVPEHWLIAEDVAAVDPALVGLHEGKPHVVKTQNVVADLIAVVQHQQRQIEELRRLVAAK